MSLACTQVVSSCHCNLLKQDVVYGKDVIIHVNLHLTKCIRVDSSTVIRWTSSFVFLDVSGLFCRFHSFFDGISSKQTM